MIQLLYNILCTVGIVIYKKNTLEKKFLKILQYSQENTDVGVSF